MNESGAKRESKKLYFSVCQSVVFQSDEVNGEIQDPTTKTKLKNQKPRLQSSFHLSHFATPPLLL
jgi:hypothetical protein